MRTGKKNGGLAAFFSLRGAGRNGARANSRSLAEDEAVPLTVSSPTNFHRVAHISYRAATGVFSGLDFSLNTQLFFGAPITSQPRVDVEGYSERLPSILILLAKSLIERDGLKTEGIFRVPAEAAALQRSRAALNAGRGMFALEHEDGPHIVAGLIKDWFRSLPQSLLGKISAYVFKENLVNMNLPDEELFETVCNLLEEPNKSVFCWIIDLLSMVCVHGKENLMTPKALSVVFAPSLWSDVSTESFEVLNNVARVIEKCITFESTSRPESMKSKEEQLSSIDLSNAKPHNNELYDEEIDEDSEWVKKRHPKTGDPYYESKITGVTRWDKPSELEERHDKQLESKDLPSSEHIKNQNISVDQVHEKDNELTQDEQNEH